MQENRSFDHYYGTYPGVRGFDDHPKGDLGVFAQAWPGGRDRTLLPFHLDSSPGHRRVHRGPRPQLAGRAPEPGQRHQRRLRAHARAARVRGARARRPHHGLLPAPGPSLLLRAGRRLHHRRQLPLLGARADAPQPPDGALGDGRPHGPRRRPRPRDELVTRRHLQRALGHHPRGARGRRRQLEGVQPDGRPSTRRPFFEQHGILSDAILPYFAQYKNPSSALYQKAFLPQYPSDFAADVASGQLPAVSWLIPPAGYDEHPSSPPALGEWYTSQVLATLTSNPEVWSKTVLFHMYDENDGFFDHVAPPVPPAGTRGRVPDPAHPAVRRQRDPRPRRHELPGAAARDLALQPGRPRGVTGLRPHLADALPRGALRRARPQHLGLAPQDGGRPDVDAAPRPRRRLGAGAAQHGRRHGGCHHGRGHHRARDPQAPDRTCRSTRCRSTRRCRGRNRPKGPAEPDSAGDREPVGPGPASRSGRPPGCSHP